MRLAKIIATLGPATQNPESIRALIEAGVNVFRLNFSHADFTKLAEVVKWIREISDELDKAVAILGDLQGPKIRIGELEGHQPVMLERGETIRFSSALTPGNSKVLTTNTPQILEDLNVGDTILINDGLYKLKVIERISAAEVNAEIINGGLLTEKKGINVPGLRMPSLSAMTDKDHKDALFALENELDYLALSFVRSYQDILYLRRFLADNVPLGKTPPLIVAKIEKPQALDEIDAIIETTDALMVARGDLGVEMSPEKVPSIQKMLIAKCNEAEKPVITATQMLETMIQQATPTRAEVSDVANAVFDGSDALMLSGETAVGQYPVEVVKTMARIIEEAESNFQEWHVQTDLQEMVAEASSDKALKFHQAIAQAACYAARKAKTSAIVVLSFSGRMALRISKRKPQKPIIALTPHNRVYRMMSLFGGVYPLRTIATENSDETLLEAEKRILKQGLLKVKDPIVFCVGQTHLMGISNTVKIYPFGDVLQQPQWSDQTAKTVSPLSETNETAPTV